MSVFLRQEDVGSDTSLNIIQQASVIQQSLTTFQSITS
jgi:hypothetical protein